MKQMEKLRGAVRQAQRSSKFFRDKLVENKLDGLQVQSMEDFQRIPFTSKSELVENQKRRPPYGDFTSNATPIKMVFMSPGPIYEPYTQRDLETVSELFAEVYRVCDVTPDDVIQITFSYHFMPAGFLFHIGAQQLGALAMPAGTGETKQQLEAMRIVGTTVYVGTPSYLGRIGDVAGEIGLDARKDLKLKVAVVAAEPLPDSLRTELQSRFGVRVHNAYGLAEAPLICQECKTRDGMHVNEDFYFVEIIDSQTGEVLGPGEKGEIVVTPFWHEALPLIRYRTGDIAAIVNEKCACGRTSPRIPTIYGRADSLVKVRGVFVHPKQVEATLSKYKFILRFQLVVDRPQRMDRLTIRIELEKTQLNEEIIKRTLIDDLKQALRLDIEVELLEKGRITPKEKILVDRRSYV